MSWSLLYLIHHWKQNLSLLSYFTTPCTRTLNSNLLSMRVKRNSDSSAQITLLQLDACAETNWKSWPHHYFSFDLWGLCRRSHMSCLRSLTRRWLGTTVLKDFASTCSKSWPTSWASRMKSAWCLMGNMAPRMRRASGMAWSGNS